MSNTGMLLDTFSASETLDEIPARSQLNYSEYLGTPVEYPVMSEKRGVFTRLSDVWKRCLRRDRSHRWTSPPQPAGRPFSVLFYIYSGSEAWQPVGELTAKEEYLSVEIESLAQEDFIGTANTYSKAVPYVEHRFSIDESWDRLRAEVERLFAWGTEEDFEDGKVSYFSDELESLILRHGNKAIVEIDRLLFRAKSDEEVSAQAVRSLGRLKDLKTEKSRLWLLEKGLSHASVQVRDGALLGLALLNNKAAIPILEEALGREKNKELREDMSKVLQRIGG